MATLWDRRHQRIEFRASVEVAQARQEQAMRAIALNLSEAGIFVAATCPAEVGTEVTCFVPLGGEIRSLRGRVAWVRAVADPRGMGIEFIDLTSSDSRVLRETVGDEDDHPITVWFQGLRDPVGARAMLTPTGMRLRAALPFLRIGSPVEFAPTDRLEERHRGRLHDARLFVTPGEPTLIEVDVALTPPARGRVSRAGAGPAAHDVVSGVLESESGPAPKARPRIRPRRTPGAWIGRWITAGVLAGAVVLALELAIARRTRALPLLPDLPIPESLPVPAPELEPIPERQAPPDPSPPLEPRALLAEDGRLFIPVSGRLDEARRLHLADPPALILDLPHATTPLAAGEHPLDQGGFRLLKVRIRPAGGIQLRVFFTHDPPGVAAVEPTPGGLAIVFGAARSSAL